MFHQLSKVQTSFFSHLASRDDFLPHQARRRALRVSLGTTQEEFSFDIHHASSPSCPPLPRLPHTDTRAPVCQHGSENANNQLRLHRFHRNVVSSTSEHQAVHRLQHASPNGALKRPNSQAPRPARSTFKTTREPDDDARQNSACTSPRPPHGALLKLSAPPSLTSKNGTWHQPVHLSFQRSRSTNM